MAKPLYFIETTSPRIRGAWFIECDRDQNSRAHVIGLIRSGEVDPVKVLEVDEDAGTCRDVSAEILEAAGQNAAGWDRYCENFYDGADPLAIRKHKVA